MLKELSVDLNSIKKILSETKGTLIEVNSLQGNNTRVDEAKIKSMIWKIRKQKTTNQNNKKKNNPKKVWDYIKYSTICITGVPGGEEIEQEIENLFQKNNKRKLP